MTQVLPKYLYIVAGFVGLVLVSNLLILDYFLVTQRGDLLDFQTRLTQLSESFKLLGGRLLTVDTGAPTPIPITNTSCPASCVGLITMATISAKPIVTTVSTAPTTSTQKGEYFVPLGVGSVAQTSNWTDISTAQATFDASNYGNIKSAYFEVILHVPSGEVHARLFDSSTPAIFWTTDLKSTSYGGEFLSAPITLSSGSKVYKVQMYSTITSGFLDQARIRIVTQ